MPQGSYGGFIGGGEWKGGKAYLALQRTCCRKRGRLRGNGQTLSLKGSLGLVYRDLRPRCQDSEQAKVLPEHWQAHAVHVICQGPKGRLLQVLNANASCLLDVLRGFYCLLF